MRARHDVHDDERIEYAEPQGGCRIDAVGDGKTGEIDDKQCEPGERGEPEEQGRKRRLLRGEGGNPAREEKPDGAVGSRCLRPHRVDAVLEPPVDDRDSGLVGILAGRHHTALGEVGVDVAAEERRSKHERCHPRDEHRDKETRLDAAKAVRIVGVGEQVVAQDEPGLEEQGNADEDEGAREEQPRGRATQCIHADDVDQPAAQGQPAHAERSDREDERADEPGKGVAREEAHIPGGHDASVGVGQVRRC